MTIKTYHYYMLGAFSFVVWIGAVVFALEVALRLSA
jgi:nitric oxide reductase large subunit